jgi:Fe-S-cluster-containing dehydrogenase component
MQYGFLMDHRRCIGCHACTVACKSENDVPLGSFRTWVKYTEKGSSPPSGAISRCCAATLHERAVRDDLPGGGALQAPDGIVDLDRDACIGCRACMQGCPYDAIYMNEDSGAAEKCHFCAHSIEQKLAPPAWSCARRKRSSSATSTIRLEDRAHGEGARTLLRRTEQRTGRTCTTSTRCRVARAGPRGATRDVLWTRTPNTKPEPWPASVPTRAARAHGARCRSQGAVGSGRRAYLVTKGHRRRRRDARAFAGAARPARLAAKWGVDVVAFVFTLITTFLADRGPSPPIQVLPSADAAEHEELARQGRVDPDRVLDHGDATLACTWFMRPTHLPPALDQWSLDHLVHPLRWIIAVLGLGVAGYTAFLFAQCEGRDLWQSKLLLPHLLVQALVCGASIFLFFNPRGEELRILAIAALVLHGVLMLAEKHGKHSTANARQAAAFLGVFAGARCARSASRSSSASRPCCRCSRSRPACSCCRS